MGIIFLLLLGITSIKVLRLLGARAQRQLNRQVAANYEAELASEALRQAEIENAFRNYAARAEAKAKVVNPDLQCLGLDSMPKDYPSLKAAWKKAMFKAHPDRGGSTALAARINNAFAKLRQEVAV